DAAAGAAGLIKTVLALQHKTLPASLNYEQPNSKIDFNNGPFVVNQHAIDWPESDRNSGSPRRAGVSSFGMGGTNAHAILEEAPQLCPSGESRPWQLIVLSAKTATALATASQNLADHLTAQLNQQPNLNLADVAYTLQIGRRAWPHRRFCICQGVEDAVQQLSKSNDSHQSTADSQQKSVVFMFSGQGAQHIDMARELYETESVFKKSLDQCAEILANEGIDLIKLIYPSVLTGETPILRETTSIPSIHQTAYAQPALFAIEYALAQLWMAWGVQPQAMIGHSIGEYVAACVAGVFSLKEAIALIVKRGQLMQRCTPGSMLSVLATAATLQLLLTHSTELAVINSPQNCVVSGPTDAIKALQQQLDTQNIPCRLLATSHAFHSAMMEPALAEFSQALEKVTLSPPTIDVISNVTGTWIEDSEAIDPNYWVRHLRQSVRFSEGIKKLLSLPNPIFLEVGPGHTLTKFVQQHLPTGETAAETGKHIPVIQSLPHPQAAKSALNTLMTALGELWLAGSTVKWSSLYQGTTRHRMPLPTYPFERQSYWIPLQEGGETDRQTQSSSQRKAADMADWFYLPTWKRLPLTAEAAAVADNHWLIFAESDFQAQLQAHLSILKTKPKITWVKPGTSFTSETDGYTIQPHHADDYQQLMQSLVQAISATEAAIAPWPTQIVYGWGITHRSNDANSNDNGNSRTQPDDFRSLTYLTQAIAAVNKSCTISIVTTDIYDVISTDSLNPHKAKVIGFSQAIAQECPGLCCRLIDVGVTIGTIEPQALQRLYRELAT
ncbi:MAG: type I polyketide synthase, partial [Cyanobacteria bacterium J06576_12]